MWFVILGLVTAPFLLIVLRGAPYVPTKRLSVEAALDLLDLQRGQTVLDLGSGDGTVLLAAAKRGLNAVGYELNPFLCLVARIRTWRYRKRVKVLWRDFFFTRLPKTEGVYLFQIEKAVRKLETKLDRELGKDTKVVSLGFEFKHKKPVTRDGALILYRF